MLLEEIVFAIPTSKLWELLPHKKCGLIAGKSDVLNRIIENGVFKERDKLEEDPSFKQIISYAIISNKDSYYLFKRTSNQAEKRLHNKFSIGIGGHMNPDTTKGRSRSYLIDELLRELFEEVKFSTSCSIESIDFIGFINDDTIPVGKVHIGLLYNIRVSNREIKINESSKMIGDWVKRDSLTDYYNTMESWSRIAIDGTIE